MRRTTADRQRRRALVDHSVSATTPVTEPGPVPLIVDCPHRIPDDAGQEPEPEVAG